MAIIVILLTTIKFQVIFATISVFIVFLQCHPTSKLWDPSAEGTCWSPNILNDFSYWLSAYTTLTDIILAVVPISIFWKLQMPFSTKLGICIMMGLTLLSAIVTVVKATYLHLFTDHIDPRKFDRHSPLFMLTIYSLQRCATCALGPVSSALSNIADFRSAFASPNFWLTESSKMSSLSQHVYLLCDHSSIRHSGPRNPPTTSIIPDPVSI